MNESSAERLNRFEKALSEEKAQFFEDRTPMLRLAALVLTAEAEDSMERLRECRAQLDREQPTGLTQASLPFLASALAVTADADRSMRHIAAAREAIAAQYGTTAYTLPAAALLERFCPEEESYATLVAASRRSYDEISQRHPLLTGYEDVGALLLLALQSRGGDAARVLQCTALLKKVRCPGNLKQALACLLALQPEPLPASERFYAIRAALIGQGLRVGSGIALYGIAVLCGTQALPELLATDIAWLDRELRKKPGFGLFGVGAGERLYLACMLTALAQQAGALCYCAGLLSAVNANLPDTPECKLPGMFIL